MKSALSYSVTRKLKSKKNKNIQAAKSSKAPKQKKSSKNPKTSRTPANTIYTRHDCITVDTYKSNGSRLSNIIAYMVKNQDFSSYCQTDFDYSRSMVREYIKSTEWWERKRKWLYEGTCCLVESFGNVYLLDWTDLPFLFYTLLTAKEAVLYRQVTGSPQEITVNGRE